MVWSCSSDAVIELWRPHTYCNRYMWHCCSFLWYGGRELLPQGCCRRHHPPALRLGALRVLGVAVPAPTPQKAGSFLVWG